LFCFCFFVFFQPLYNCPWDNEVYHENIRHYQAFKSRLIGSLKKKRMERDVRDNAVAQKYRDLASSWQDKVEKMENSARRRSKDAKYRETFEKVFPELRKQREDKERFSRFVSINFHLFFFFLQMVFLKQLEHFKMHIFHQCFLLLQRWCPYQE
jgi:hypothetical protein